MNYKRSKPKEKKFIEYSTPKYVQMESEKSLHSIPGRRKYSCKKAKGEHIFTKIGSRERTFFHWKWEKFQCEVCGKKR